MVLIDFGGILPSRFAGQILNFCCFRFVKIVSEPLVGGRDREQPRDTIMNVCKRFGVPSWVVQLRHDYSHNDMHELHKLEDTLKFVARWLKVNIQLTLTNPCNFLPFLLAAVLILFVLT